MGKRSLALQGCFDGTSCSIDKACAQVDGLDIAVHASLQRDHRAGVVAARVGAKGTRDDGLATVDLACEPSEDLAKRRRLHGWGARAIRGLRRWKRKSIHRALPASNRWYLHPNLRIRNVPVSGGVGPVRATVANYRMAWRRRESVWIPRAIILLPQDLERPTDADTSSSPSSPRMWRRIRVPSGSGSLSSS